ncbi:G1 cyclin CycE4 [Novymonas esmeraldas]|uniref:G1 cyclin CycE4 n=1 Tax=Novymonas esmeraldas TaxID=1808958 RepID=A0AAW0EN68_9TRYP
MMQSRAVVPTGEVSRRDTSTATSTVSAKVLAQSALAERVSPSLSTPATPQRQRGGARRHPLTYAAAVCCAASAAHTTAADSEDDGTEDCNVMGNGCAEAVSPPSSCAGVLTLGVSLAATTRPPALQASSDAADGEDVRAVPAAPAVRLCGPRQARTAAGDHTAFTSKAMQAISALASTGKPPAPSGHSRSDLSSPVGCATRVAAGDDPIGVRHLYSLPSSRAGSSVAMPTATQRGGAAPALALTQPIDSTGATSAAAADVFSMERFAVFYEAALEELMDECERRVANAPAAWRDSQRHFICGGSNRDLATSTHSFDSPRSSAMSPLGGTTPVYPAGSATLHHNTHAAHHRSSASQPPRTAFFSAAAPTRHAEQRNAAATAAEESVPALLAALGQHHGKMAPMVFIAALAYLARVTTQCASELLCITRENWYRLTTIAILVAAKVYDEHSSTRLNARFASSSGIPLREVTRLELDFLYLIDFDLLLREAEVEQWLSWMETLALRRDLMTPLNAYVLGSHASFTATALPAKPPASSCATAFSLAQYRERSRTGTMGDASRTVGLSSEALEGEEEETVWTSPSSALGPRSFSHVRVSSNTMDVRRAAAALAGDVPSHSSHMIELFHFPPPSPASSVALPASLLDGVGSAVSALSVPGGGTASSLTGRRAHVPPSPVHGVLPPRPPAPKSRLFSVVHSAAEPPSPISLRQLCQLGGSPPSPMRPPSADRHSPVRFFFKAPAGQQPPPPVPRQTTTTTSNRGRHGGHTGEDTGCAAARESLPLDAARAAGGSATAPRPSAAAAVAGAEAKRGTPGTAAPPPPPPPKARWGPLGMVQHVRDVLGVTASLVRGQLNVLAPASHTEEAGRPAHSQAPRPTSLGATGSGARVSHPPASSSSAPAPYRGVGNGGGAYPPFPAKLRDERAGEGALPRRPPGSPPRPSPGDAVGRSTGAGMAAARPTPRHSPMPPPPRSSHSDPTRTSAQLIYSRPAADADGEEEDDYDYGEEEEEECEYGYYDEEGCFHYYTEEEEEECEYDDGDEEGCFHYYTEEEEEEEGEYDDGDEDYEDDGGEEEEEAAAFFQRCRPPLTHSPPSL